MMTRIGIINLMLIILVIVGFYSRPICADPKEPSVEKLLKKLEQRDALVFDLERRLKQVERQVDATPLVTAEKGEQFIIEQTTIIVQRGDTLYQISRRLFGGDARQWQQIYEANRDQLPHPDAVKTGMKLVVPAGGVIIAAEPENPAYAGQAVLAGKVETKEVPGNNAQAGREPSKGGDAESAPGETADANDASTESTGSIAAPGQFEVDEEAAERALERTLVQEGALLLRFGQLEVQPSFTYTRSETDNEIFVNITEEGNASEFITTEKVRRDIVNANIALRAGLPFDSQFELSIPYKYVDRSPITELPASLNTDDEKNHESGVGDIRVGFAKTLMREDGWWPDLIGRLTWDTATGQNNIGGLSNGFKEAIGSLTFLKRQDPLAFIGSVGYERVFEKDDFKPGDQLDFSIGVALAASPETSLRFILSQSFVKESELDNKEIRGSDQTLGTLTIGASSIVGHGTFLNLSTGIGLTEGASDYSVGLSITKRFGWLSYF